jgi:hypothetical protein
MLACRARLVVIVDPARGTTRLAGLREAIAAGVLSSAAVSFTPCDLEVDDVHIKPPCNLPLSGGRINRARRCRAERDKQQGHAPANQDVGFEAARVGFAQLP